MKGVLAHVYQLFQFYGHPWGIFRVNLDRSLWYDIPQAIYNNVSKHLEFTLAGCLHGLLHKTNLCQQNTDLERPYYSP